MYPDIIDCLDPTLVALYKDEADANNMSIPEYLSRLKFIQTDDVQIAYQYKCEDCIIGTWIHVRTVRTRSWWQ